MSIRIVKQGLFDTVQDHGRYGYQHLGINPGGNMDTIAATLANMLVGNEPGEAVIEMHFPAPIIEFQKTCIIALSGGNFSACINNESVPLNTMLILTAGTTLSFKKYIAGARIYLAIQGGLSIEPWLNSYSTNTKAKAGGYSVRQLKKDDILHCKAEQFAFSEMPSSSFVVTPVTIDSSFFYSTVSISCIAAKDFEGLIQNSKAAFTNTSFTISRQSDRMGYRLQGSLLEHTDKTERLSTAVTKGSVQLLPDGQLLLLMADHQTTGGYPIIAYVTSSAIPTLAQMQPGSIIQFRNVDISEAEELYSRQQQYLKQLQEHCNLQLKQFLS